MALVTCPDCSTEISTKAEACPKCGRSLASKGITLGDVLFVLFLVFFVLPLGFCAIAAAVK